MGKLFVDRRDIAAADAETAADELLESSGALGARSGIYTQAQLERRIRRDRRRAPRCDELSAPPEVRRYLFERTLEDLIDVSRLSLLEEIAFRLRVTGLDCRNMAATLGIDPSTMAHHLRLARRKVRASYAQGRYAGWYEVYLSEVNRPAYRARNSR